MYEIQTYLTDRGEEPYASWLHTLPDRQAKARIVVRVNRMSGGNLGDVKPVGEGVWEAKINYGPGYRLYYAQAAAPLASCADLKTTGSSDRFAQQGWRDLPVLSVVGAQTGSLLIEPHDHGTFDDTVLGGELNAVALGKLGQLDCTSGLGQQVQTLDNQAIEKQQVLFAHVAQGLDK
jgi:putative addiction module killer protein